MSDYKDTEKSFIEYLEQADKNTLELAKKKTSEFVTLMTYYKCAMMEIETKLNVLDEEYSLQHDRNPINSIKSRLKNPKSIANKLKRKGLEFNTDNIFEHINDVAGIRVICGFQEDVYTLAKALLSQDDVTLISKKDYISAPKENGYRSLHLIIAVPIFLANKKHIMKVEIQLRTIAMDCWASLEHQLRYKKNRSYTDEMIKELYDCAMLSQELDDRMDNLKKQVYNN